MKMSWDGRKKSEKAQVKATLKKDAVRYVHRVKWHLEDLPYGNVRRAPFSSPRTADQCPAILSSRPTLHAIPILLRRGNVRGKWVRTAWSFMRDRGELCSPLARARQRHRAITARTIVAYNAGYHGVLSRPQPGEKWVAGWTSRHRSARRNANETPTKPAPIRGIRIFMQLATWNVNSLKVRLGHVQDWLRSNPVDVLCLQELKLTDENFPITEIAALGYTSHFTGQKTYNGVAMLVNHAKVGEATDLVKNLPNFADEQQRLITATIGGVRVVCGYFPNGQAVDSDKFVYKLNWLDALTHWLSDELVRHPRLALLGDYNIAPEDRDVHDPAKWEGQNLVSPQERQAFARLQGLGLRDTFRMFDQPEKTFSWWDYRMGAFRRNAGLRIDHILVSSALAERCTGCEIDRVPRTWEQPSDHTPVIATFKD